MALIDIADPTDAAPTIAHSSLATKVYEALRASLANGELPPEHKLNGRLVAERLGVSQTPVREAMLQLVAERALTMNRNKSVTVPALTAEKFVELRDIRVALETLAGRGAVQYVTEADVQALEAVHGRMMVAKQTEDFQTTMRLNREVHLGIYRLSRRTELVALIESLWVRTGPYLNLIYRKGQPIVEPHEHERLFAALRARDADGCAASIERDIVNGGAPVVEALRTGPAA